MNTAINIGLIASGAGIQEATLSSVSIQNGYQLKKVLINEALPARMAETKYPGAELVEGLNAILLDDSINLVVLAGNAGSDLNLIKQVSDAGKYVRII